MARARDLSNLAWAFATLDLRKFDSVFRTRFLGRSWWWCCFSLDAPWKINSWNLQITHLGKWSTSMSMFHVNLQGCTCFGKTMGWDHWSNHTNFRVSYPSIPPLPPKERKTCSGNTLAPLDSENYICPCLSRKKEIAGEIVVLTVVNIRSL